MRKYWAIALLFLLWPAQAQATEEKIKDWMLNVFQCRDNPCLIRNNGGGIVERFENAAEQALEKHILVKIDGECSSACVIFASKARENVCLTDDARMGIHMGYTFTLVDPEGKVVSLDITTGKNVDKYEHPPKGYKRVGGHYVDIDYGPDLNVWAHEFGKMPRSNGVYTLTWDEAKMFWEHCE